jgi:dihydrolipoamide dehydrogenase
VNFDSTTRTIIDGRRLGFCKLVVDRQTAKILGCHVIGERAVDIAEVATIVIAAAMRVDELARIPLSYPTYAGILVNVAVKAAHELGHPIDWQAHQAA